MKDFSPNPAFRQPLFRGHLCAVFVLGMLILGVPCLHSQTQVGSAVNPGSKRSVPSVSKVAAVKSFRIVQEEDGSALEILSTRPLVPAIQAMSNPDRLVIDLPNARLDASEKRVSVQADQISAIRADQFQQNPPVARLVVDLLAPRAYTWDAAGNRLLVHLGKSPNEPTSSPFQAPDDSQPDAHAGIRS